jgi:uncharacterized protein YceH (UPF0502 family)
MNIRLTAIEARIIGALIEKQITTPDQYPLSLNALINACNQKSNREPLMQLDEPTVKFVVDGLGRRHMVVEKSGFGSRVPKYQQVFCNTEFGSLKFTPQETAIVCELLLRGPQTPGELRSRAPRMADFPDPGVIESVLAGSRKPPGGAIVVRLAREPNRRDSRWAQLFEELPASAVVASADELAAGSPDDAATPRAPSNAQLVARVAELEAEIAALRAELAALKQVASLEPAGLGAERGPADRVECLHDVCVVCASQEHGGQALGDRRTRKLGHRPVRIPGAGARQSHRLHHDVAGPAQGDAGSHHARGVRAVRALLYEAAAEARLLWAGLCLVAAAYFMFRD